MTSTSKSADPAGAPDAEIRFRDRATGAIVTERVFSVGALRFLYERPAGRLLLELALKHAPPSHIYGFLQRSSRSRARIAHFVETLGIDASEAERPLEEYESLDAFFTRRLRPGARPIDRDPDHLVSPGDGRLLVLPRTDARPFAVKGSRVTVAELLADARLARRYEGGAGFVLRLAPADYHRFHFPEGGIAGAPRRVRGPLHSVHPIALRARAPSFRNKRVVTRLDTRAFGEIAIIEVGALCVGTMVQTYTPGPVERGDEKGYFRFGGSTIVVLTEPGRVEVDADLLEWSAIGAGGPEIETYVRMGTRIARRAG